MPTLIIFSGLPGTGKTATARELARQIGATYLRIDSIEQAIRDSGASTHPMSDAGYRIGYALAEENLLLGRDVIADSVNPLSLTRDAWLEVAKNTHARALEIEIQCSDATEHRHRVETRASDIPGLRLPTWNEIVSREYHVWEREPLIIDTASCDVETAVQLIQEKLKGPL